MTRKILIYVISVLMIALGVTQILTFLLPIFDSTEPKIFNVTLVFIGLLFFLAGWELFALKEAGRELTFWLLFMALMGNLLAIGFILPSDSHFGVSIRLLGKPILNSKDNYVPTIISLSVLFVINLSIILFISHGETKKIFMPETKNNVHST